MVFGIWSGSLDILISLLVVVVIYLLIAQWRLSARLKMLERTQTGPEQGTSGAVKTPPKPARKVTKSKVAAAKAAPSANVSSPVEGNPWQKAAASSTEENKGVLAASGAVKAATPAPKRSKRYVFDPALIGQAASWAKDNWFYLVAAASLGLAGVFLVQYGVENGILPPKLRVLAALGLGVALIAFGEYLRRRGGDKAGELFAYLPSTFAAGGLLALFAGISSARVLYDLIAPETALIGLAMVGLLAVLVGWFYGAVLAGIGILGAIAAPFVVGGEADGASLLYGYFAVIVIVAMAVDTFKRWAWLSGFGAVLGYLAAANIYGLAGGSVEFLAFGLVVTIAAATIPERRLFPAQSGVMVLEVLAQSFRKSPELSGETGFPTRLVAGVFAATSGATIWVQTAETGIFWLAITALSILFIIAAIWMRGARALGDLVILPMIGLPTVLWLEMAGNGTVFQAWATAAQRLAEDPAPWTGTAVMLVGLLSTLILAWRAYFGAPYRNLWSLGAAVFAPVIVVVFELFWQPSLVLGEATWATYVITLAAVMVVLAQRFARIDGEDRTATAYFTLAAMSMISLALMLMLSAAALTVALGVMVLGAVLLDRQYNLPALSVFVVIGAGVVSWRLVVDPGLEWALYTRLWEVSGVFVAVLLMLWISRFLLRASPRRKTFGVVDGVFWSLSALFASIQIYRLIDLYSNNREDSHAAASLIALVWLVSSANQLWRLQYDELRRWIRITLACIYALPGFALLAIAVTLVNPLFGSWDRAFGPYILDSLFVAYGLVGLFFLSVATWFKHLPNLLRATLAVLGVGFASFYVALEIRRIWRGDDLSVPGTTDAELYTYTVVMLLAATALLFYAFYRHNNLLRKIALAGIGLTVAKVFLIDVSGLTGLTRVFSFLGLGLSVAGLAWLDRWFGGKHAPETPAD
jgi:uncharacterized membrane protein